jgi:ABC-type amino acid transport substrate-binding protein
MLRTKAERGHGSRHSAVSPFVAIALASLLLAGVAAAQTKPETSSEIKTETKSVSSNHLRGGWYPWDPYQYRDYKRGVPVLTGFDVEIERALGRIMGVEIDLPEIAWKDHLAALMAGTADIAAGATASEARGLYAYFSQPYRTETDVLILPRGASRGYAALWGLAFAVFLEWEGERLQPDEIRIAVIVTILGVFLTRIAAIARGMKGWRYI